MFRRGPPTLTCKSVRNGASARYGQSSHGSTCSVGHGSDRQQELADRPKLGKVARGCAVFSWMDAHAAFRHQPTGGGRVHRQIELRSVHSHPLCAVPLAVRRGS